eukprot:CAMPEP_0118663336 /NCGR_PEP_ID=MMETSP0785-20121206/17361_1 /TAXON_ID=91992 /ORGANISM="Bolidomonas pacifica, Strain CCMP 1866" /LENGTH=314 /DNA_ID=CAMNT_0006557041 /DNA_START=276 /DNA_END=1217 /DNA_ORIENTATION=-
MSTISISTIPFSSTSLSSSPPSSDDEKSQTSQTSLSSHLSISPPTTPRPSSPSNPYSKILIYGHRGSLYDECENTLPSYLACSTHGSDGVELDVFRLKCGTLVCYHGTGTDEEPGRMGESHGVNGGISWYTWDEVDRMEVKESWDEGVCGVGKLKGAKVPRLRDALELCKRVGMGVKVELKEDGIEEDVVEMIESLSMSSVCSISSFKHSRLLKCKSLSPSIKTGALFSSPLPPDFVSQAEKVKADEVHLRYDTCTTDKVREAKNAGFGVMAWFRGPLSMLCDSEGWDDAGNEDEDMYRIVMGTGVDTVCVNRP